MSSTSMAHSPRSNFQLIIDSLVNYGDQTGIDLSKSPFADKLRLSNDPDAVLELLHERERAFKEYRDGNRQLMNWLKPAVQVIYACSDLLGELVSLVPFPPAKAILVGFDILLATASDVSSSYDALVDLFECIANFLRRLSVYTKIPPSPELTDIIVKIMVELLSVLALATKQIKQGRFKKFAKKLLGESEVESVLQRLDRLTEDEARMAIAQTLDVVHGLMNIMKVVMDDGKVSIDSIRQALVTMHQTANEVNKMKRDQLQRDVQHWLSPPDPSTNHGFVWKAHHSGSGSWFFNSRILTEWKAFGSLLWIHGKPGSGKSTLVSTIIQDIQDMCKAGLATMAFYYFDFRDVKKQHRNGLLSSLLSQLCAESDSFCDVLSQLQSSHAGGAWKPTDTVLTKCLRDMLSLPGRNPIYIIIDALDECPNNSGTPSAREEVLDLVKELVDFGLPNVHVCVTSRPEIDIRAVLEPLTTLRISLHDESGQKQDIVDYITAVVQSDRNMRKWRKEDQELVINTLSEKADGMFRWVVCQIDRLRRSFPASIRSALNDLPKTLDETYGHTLLSIDDEKREYAQRLFRCLAVSIRPLRVQELAEILAVQFDPVAPPMFSPDWRPMDAEEAVLSACSSFITILNVDGSQVVQFSHFSVREFLTSDRLATREERLSYYHILPVAAHTVLAHASLSVLLQLDDKIDKDTISQLPLAPYAARHWVDHAQIGDVSSRIKDVMEPLFDRGRPHFAAWLWLHDMDRDWVEPMLEVNPTQPQAMPLYYASLCGFRGLVEHLAVTHPPEVNATSGSHMTPLNAASVKGHLEVARLLLKHGADPNRQDDRGWTALHLAARGGYLAIVESLLEHGADVDSLNWRNQTPLFRASVSGKLEVAQLLLNHGANVNSLDSSGNTPLHRASQYGHIDVVRLLVDCGSDVGPRYIDRRTPLHIAALNGHLSVVQLLLEHGANVDPVDDQHWTPLHVSSETGHLDVVRLLLEHGTNVDPVNDDSHTPLHISSWAGHLDVVQLLLKHGADLNAPDKNHETPWDHASSNGRRVVAQFLLERSAAPCSHQDRDWDSLHTASKNGHLDVVRSLLQRGEDVNLRNMKQETPVLLASGNGNIEVLRFLLHSGADVNAPDQIGWGPLHLASQKGHLDIVQLLLDHGAHVNAQNTDGRTPLDHASNKGTTEVALLLINHGANLDSRDKKGRTSLHRASYQGHLDVMQLLIEHSADPNSEDVDGRTPLDLALEKGNMEVAQFLRTHGANAKSEDIEDWNLHKASEKGLIDVVKSLLEHGEDVNAQDSLGQTPLGIASYCGLFSTVQLLLKWGANVDCRDNDGWSPLHLAAEQGHLDTAKILLEHGANINAQSKSQRTPLYWAAHFGHLGVVQLLLQRGANAHLQASDGRTAFHIAAATGHHDVAQLLSASPGA